MAAIIKGTTPTIIYTFNEISVANIVTAVLTIKRGTNTARSCLLPLAIPF